MDNKKEATSIVFLKMDEEELLGIFDNFTDILIHDKAETLEEDSSVFDFLEETIREMATGEEVLLMGVNPAILSIIEIFMNHFHIDLDTKTYRFIFENCIAEGSYEYLNQEKINKEKTE